MISIKTFIFFTALLSIAPKLLVSNDKDLEIAISASNQRQHTIQFTEIPIIEFVRYVSKVSDISFLYDQKDLNFKVSLSGSKPVSTDGLVKALISLLKNRGYEVVKQNECFVIQKVQPKKKEEPVITKVVEETKVPPLFQAAPLPIPRLEKEPLDFSVYKVKYHQGSEIESALKKIAAEGALNGEFSPRLLKAIQSVQWVKATNSLLFSAEASLTPQLTKLIESLDVALRQVFIEVLVVETDAKKSTDFGLQWGGGGVIDERVGFGSANTIPLSAGKSGFGGNISGVNPSSSPSGLSQLPLVGGFDMGVIGDIIMHKGKSYLTLGALVHALESDTTSTIVLNQKIITQDNKNSTIFVGDNIPFTGSIVQTVGQSQQTTANIEYRDVGVKLSITPMLGENNVITLDINQEITESLDHFQPSAASNVNGIRTTKTNMVTHVHVPDQHFLVLSGMIRNAQLRHKTAVPCLGGLPVLGAAFSNKKDRDEKRNIIIFVRPRIITSMDEYKNITEGQKDLSESFAPGLKNTIDNVQGSNLK